MKATAKYLDEKGEETTKDKAVARQVSVYDDDGNFLYERFGPYQDEKKGTMERE